MLFKGTATALITPFNENGVDYDAFESQIEYQIQNGISALVVCGTTGEPSTMTKDEYFEVINFAVKHIKNRVPVIVGTGTNCTASTIEASVMAEKLGADALLIVSPYYNKCTQNGLVLHYSTVANASGLPIIVYNVPKRTGVNILPETYLRLSEIRTVKAIKEASGDLEQIRKVCALLKDTSAIYSGDDNNIIDVLELGGMGVISVTSNLLPKEINQICTLYFENEITKAKELASKYKKLLGLLFCEVNPIPIKAAVNLQNRRAGLLRLPLTEMEEANKSLLKEEMQNLGII